MGHEAHEVFSDPRKLLDDVAHVPVAAARLNVRPEIRAQVYARPGNGSLSARGRVERKSHWSNAIDQRVENVSVPPRSHPLIGHIGLQQDLPRVAPGAPSA